MYFFQIKSFFILVKTLLVMFVFGLLPNLALGQDTTLINEISFDTSGYISAYGQLTDNGGTDLVPNPSGSKYSGKQEGYDVVLQMRLDYQKLRLKSQIRLERAYDDTQLLMDEAYGEYSITDQVLFFAGRRIIAYGQSYGLNPADILHDPLQEVKIYPSDKSRNDIEGTDMVGFDWFTDNGAALTMFFAPRRAGRENGDKEDLLMVRYAGFSMEGALDYGLSAFTGDRMGLGLSASYGVGEATVLYIDSSMRYGREKKSITGHDRVGNLFIIPADKDAIIIFTTFGAGHSFNNGWSVNLEYSHDSGGYSSGEWGRIEQALTIITPANSAVMERSLGQVNNLLDHYMLRKNYGFIRLAHDKFADFDLASEFSLLHSLDDGSGSIGTRFELPLSDNVTAGLYGSLKYGGSNKEFTLRPNASALAFYTMVKF